MDEKLGIKFQKNAKMQNYSYFAFLFEKRIKSSFNAGFDKI